MSSALVRGSLYNLGVYLGQFSTSIGTAVTGSPLTRRINSLHLLLDLL